MEVLYVGAPAQEPQELMDNRAQVALFRRYEREAVLQAEPHLVAEYRPGAGSGPVILEVPLLKDRP